MPTPRSNRTRSRSNSGTVARAQGGNRRTGARGSALSSSSIDSRDDNHHAVYEDGTPIYVMNKMEEASMCNLYLAALVSNMGTILFGFDVGAVPWILQDIILKGNQASVSEVDNYYVIVANSEWLQGAIMSSSTFGTAIGYWFLLFVGNDMSKRFEMQMASIFFILGGSMMGYSLGCDWSTGGGADWVALLTFGHFVFGLGGSCVLHSVPQYLAELCPRQLRGRFGATIELGAGTGIVLGQIAGYFFCNSEWYFQDDATSGVYIWVCAIIFALLYILFIHTGRLPTEIDYMLKNGWTNVEGRVVQYTRGEVLESIRFVYPRAHDGTVTQYKRRLKKVMEEEQNWQEVYNKVLVEVDYDDSKSKGGIFSWLCCWLGPVKTWLWNNTRLEVKILFKDEIVRRILLVGTLLKVFDLLVGVGVFMWASVAVFYDLGDVDGTYVIGLTVTKFVTACVVFYFVEYFPRRSWMLTGGAIMIASLMALLVFLHFGYNMLAIWSTYVWVMGYQMSYGSISWVIISEILPKFVRSAGNSIIIGNAIQSAALVIFIVPSMFEYFGISGTFAIFLFFTLLGTLFLYLFIPETRGVDLDLEGHALAHKQYLHGVSKLCCTQKESGLGLRKQMSSIFEEYQDGSQDTNEDTGTVHSATEHNPESDYSTTGELAALGSQEVTQSQSLNDSFGSGDDPNETTPLF